MSRIASTIVYDDLHVYPKHEASEHSLGGGPGACVCEPEMESVHLCGCGHFIRRVIVHNDMKAATKAKDLAGTVAGAQEEDL